MRRLMPALLLLVVLMPAAGARTASIAAASVLHRGARAAACVHGTITVTRTSKGRTVRASVCRRSIYLALGDSLAVGFQPNGDFQHGYVTDFFQMLKPRGIRKLVNLGCAGETSATFVNAGCPFAITLAYAGSQLHEALSYIRTHTGQIGIVTIDIGGNDFLNNFDAKTCTPAPGYPTVLATFDTNFKSILGQLRTALHGSARLITMNYYNVYANECAGHPAALATFVTANGHIAADARLYRVPVANVFGAFGGATAPNPGICPLTWICGPKHDIHATTKGYQLIARAFKVAAAL